MKVDLLYAQECVRRDYGHAQDAIYRAKMQQKRMPYDHDNNDALVKYNEWERKAGNALNYLQKLIDNYGSGA